MLSRSCMTDVTNSELDFALSYVINFVHFSPTTLPFYAIIDFQLILILPYVNEGKLHPLKEYEKVTNARTQKSISYLLTLLPTRVWKIL